MVGVIQITLGLARLGYLVRLVPQSVLVGFSSAAALIIAMTQIPYLFGFHASSGTFVALQIFNIIRHIAQTRPLTMLIGISALGLLIALRRFVPKYPASLALLVLGIAVSYFFDLAGHGVTIAGSIPARLPITDIPMLSPAVIFSLAGNAFVIALVGFMSSYVVVKEMAGRGKDTVSADQELIGQGFANLFAGIFHGYPVGGSLSRTAVNYEAGATTAWSGVFASIIVALSILFLSPLISYLPNAVLAAIVIAAAASLVDVPHIRRIHQISTMDGAIAGTTFAASFVLQASDAIFIGVVLALAMFLHRMMWADVVEVGIDRSLNVLRAIRDERDEEQGLVRLPRTLVLRINSSFFYGNSERLIEKMKSAILEREAIGGETLDFLVLECAGIDIIDGTAIEALEVFLNDLDARGTELCLIYMRRHVREVLERASDLERVRVVHNISELRQITQNKRRESTHGVEGLAIRTGIHRMTETPTA